ncbi:hypothetical protein LV780_21180 (plasmid) [Cereibacter azotoformans]|uniref:hypothetical protein n=1 Tax=Cereibacter azotoformans TaxID=43057 RepID=UPI0003245E89|nr:hypothetical protein [Cereibacter azotoformans]UIJ33142.1 hypothetical protein LV780_21180 [Cereibacter azotoformans]
MEDRMAVPCSVIEVRGLAHIPAAAGTRADAPAIPRRAVQGFFRVPEPDDGAKAVWVRVTVTTAGAFFGCFGFFVCRFPRMFMPLAMGLSG